MRFLPRYDNRYSLQEGGGGIFLSISYNHILHDIYAKTVVVLMGVSADSSKSM